MDVSNINTQQVSSNYSNQSRNNVSNESRSNVSNESLSNSNNISIVKNDVNTDTINSSTVNTSAKFIDDSVTNEVFTKKLDKALADLNKTMFNADRKLDYQVHEQTNTIMIKILDTDTNEVIKELPPENRLDVIAKLREMAGIIVDDKI